MNELFKLWKNDLTKDKSSIFISDRVFYEIDYDLSIIIPVYNVECYLNECLISLINQKTKYSFEVILIDDGSCDDSYNICARYCNNYSNFRVIKKINGGASSARNIGISESRGKFICFIDADDYVDSLFVNVMLDAIIKNDADYVKCGYFEFDSNSNKIVKETKLKNLEYNQYNCYNSNLKGHACMCVFKRELLLNVQFPEGYWYEDIIVKFILMPLCKKIITIDDVLYYYRINIDSTSNNLSSKKNFKCLSQYYLLNECVEFYKNKKLDFDYVFFKNFFFESFAMLWLRIRHLDIEVQKKVFISLCDYYNYNFNNKFRGFLLKKIILKFKFFNIWKLISLFSYVVYR